jgi:hypothetical protein
MPPRRSTLALTLVLSACAARNAARTSEPAPPAEPGGNELPADATPAEVALARPLPTTPVEPPKSPGEAPPKEPKLKPVVASGPPLPEVSVKSYGLHIGGGHADEREPIQRTLEYSFPRFLDCYPLVENPGKEGTFGIDLVVPAAGGNPELRQPRTAFRGDAFKGCMLKVFQTVRFKPQRRATAVSYSVKFSVALGE